ncbi:uncharacterized protein PITG_10784 [Phytophthora infestans T30-4]|uniref:Uncharacterized protein n=1 Tax=Phytophthora infestans (strain T30-4) TaxID=403677 RepID=D0NH30_PHYIT|nr:uncharacterized protein PITG_10784 [Phytophthora infestans T30-4]EEY58669.1 conserved hypothetical protein [Phytophthora infestans T30-4]|eukprot:XP_002901613.1 conserved hypothetical protein [Phytophthora infestans T30-4]
MQRHTLKRTISKCSMDGDSPGSVACKKFSSGLDNEPVLLPRENRAPSFPPLDELEPELARDEISASGMLTAVLDYLRDVANYCNRAVNFSFAQLRQMLQSIPFAVGQMQSVVKARLELSWPLVAAFVQNVTGFISDEDIRDASVGELAAFLQTCQTDYLLVAVSGNICANMFEFFHEVLIQFKQFLIKRWLQIGKISFPCEFGKKSDSLFLCMECHREHM